MRTPKISKTKQLKQSANSIFQCAIIGKLEIKPVILILSSLVMIVARGARAYFFFAVINVYMYVYN